jgi:hypothetical protein
VRQENTRAIGSLPVGRGHFAVAHDDGLAGHSFLCGETASPSEA